MSTRFPVLSSLAVVLFLEMFACVDQIMDMVDRFKMTRLPSWEMVSSTEVVFLTGLSLFPTHAGVNLGTALNHMPRYQLVVPSVWKKPSAYLPLPEMSLSLTASDWPAKMVSVAAEFAGVWMQESRVKTIRKGGMVNGGEGAQTTAESCCAEAANIGWCSARS